MLLKKYFNRCNAASFLTAFIALATQILVFRIISAKLFNNFAFFVISLTMLGFALSGVVLSFKEIWIKKFRKYIHYFVYLFVIMLLLSTILFYHLPVAFNFQGEKMFYLKTLFFTTSMAGLFVIPFFFVGLILGILLSHPKLPTRTIYCFDLIGSAVGALLIIFFISSWGVEKKPVDTVFLFHPGD